MKRDFNNLDYNLIRSMSKEDRATLYTQMARRMNERMRRIEHMHYRTMTPGERKVKQYLNRIGRKRFSENRKEQFTIAHIMELDYLLTLKTTTVRGYEKYRIEAYQALGSLAKTHGIQINLTDFASFLDSKEFNDLKDSHMISSNQIIDFYARATDGGLNEQQIAEALRKYQERGSSLNDLYREAKMNIFDY